VGSGEEWHRHYEMVNLAYLDAHLPNGEYNMTLTAIDALGQPYPPGTTLTFFKDSTTPYLSRATDLEVTACPPIQSTAETDQGDGSGPADTACGRCVRGVCLEGVCECEADWFGEACDLDVHDAEVYMPGNASALELGVSRALHLP